MLSGSNLYSTITRSLVERLSYPGSGKFNPELPNQCRYKIDEIEQNSKNAEEFVAGLRSNQSGKAKCDSNQHGSFN